MSHSKKILTTFFVITILLIYPFESVILAQDDKTAKRESTEHMVVDALIARPLGIVGTVLGGAVFVISLPFSALGGNTGRAYEKLLAEPARFTFQRPLGEFEEL